MGDTDEMEIVTGYDPDVDDPEDDPNYKDDDDDDDESLDIHHYLVRADGETSLCRDSHGYEDVMQRIRSESGRKGFVRFPAQDIEVEGAHVPAASVRADLISSVTEVIVVICDHCESVEMQYPYPTDDDGDPICPACLEKEEGEDDDDDEVPPGSPGGGGRVLSIEKIAKTEAKKDREVLPVGFGPG
jgi:hypothetical protein